MNSFQLASRGGRVVVCVLGPPLVGKSRLAGLLSKRYDLPVISVGDLVRRELHRGGPLAKAIVSYHGDRRYSPDEIAIGLVAMRLGEPGCRRGVILDGYPATPSQARIMVDVLLTLTDSLYTFLLETAAEVTERSGTRRICVDCDTQLTIVESEKARCPKCRSAMMERIDDEPQHLESRLSFYLSHRNELFDLLSRRGTFSRLALTREIRDTVERAVETLEGGRIPNELGQGRLATVISGSYRRYLRQLYDLRSRLESAGIMVLSPVGSSARNEGQEFVYLDADPVSDHRLLQDSIFAKLRNSSFHVLGNFGGYMGRAAVMEVGYAIGLGLQVLTVEPVRDPNIAPYCRLLHEALPNLSRDDPPRAARASLATGGR